MIADGLAGAVAGGGATWRGGEGLGVLVRGIVSEGEATPSPVGAALVMFLMRIAMSKGPCFLIKREKV